MTCLRKRQGLLSTRCSTLVQKRSRKKWTLKLRRSTKCLCLDSYRVSATYYELKVTSFSYETNRITRSRKSWVKSQKRLTATKSNRHFDVVTAPFFSFLTPLYTKASTKHRRKALKTIPHLKLHQAWREV